MILLPWKDVFTPGSMHTFLIKNIYPKLETALLHLNINPINQVCNNINILLLMKLAATSLVGTFEEVGVEFDT